MKKTKFLVVFLLVWLCGPFQAIAQPTMQVTVQSKTQMSGIMTGTYTSSEGLGLLDWEDGSLNWDSSLHLEASLTTSPQSPGLSAYLDASYAMEFSAADGSIHSLSETVITCTDTGSALFQACPSTPVGSSTDLITIGKATGVSSTFHGLQWIFYSQDSHPLGDILRRTVYLVTYNPCLPGEDCGTPISIDSLSPVPLPAAAWLFGSALLGLLGASRKRQQRA